MRRGTVGKSPHHVCDIRPWSQEPDRELRWLGRLFVPGIFDGEHFFELAPLEEGRSTRFTQGERFKGILVPFLRRSLDNGTRKGFEAMNQALKDRVERQDLEAFARGVL